jgi:NAD(P)-dependent dehydrogenase (short-subunit alcohol dehydrogenase family)
MWVGGCAGAAAAAELNALAAAPALFLPLDASDPASIQELAAAVADKYDKQIDLLVRVGGGGGGVAADDI